MNPFFMCYIEKFTDGDGLWYIRFPDGTRAWDQGFKTRAWATRTLKWLLRGDGI